MPQPPSAPPPPASAASDDGFTSVWRTLGAEGRFMTAAELVEALTRQGLDGEATWRACVADPRFATSVVCQGAPGEARYQRFALAAERMGRWLTATGAEVSRQALCARLRMQIPDAVWVNLVRRLGHSFGVTWREVDAERLYRVAAAEVAPAGASRGLERGEPEAGVTAVSARAATPPPRPTVARLSVPGAIASPGELAPPPGAPTAGGGEAGDDGARQSTRRARSGLAIGSVLDGRYELIDVLGRGGFGVVYRARQLRLQREVAIKVLRPREQLAARLADEVAARFELEMRLMTRLNHPNIVKIYDSGQTEDGALFTVLDYIDGEPLDVVLGRGPMAARLALRLMRQVANALHHAHRQGIVHRDLKPANIMVTDPGPYANALVLDFGIASLISAESDERLTQIGHFVGTPAYMAPEQIDGQRPTPQSDLYAWGLLMIECLTAQPVFADGSLPRLCAAQLSPTPVPIPPEVARGALGPLLARATAKPLSVRYASAEALLESLNALDPRALDGDAPRRPAQNSWFWRLIGRG